MHTQVRKEIIALCGKLEAKGFPFGIPLALHESLDVAKPFQHLFRASKKNQLTESGTEEPEKKEVNWWVTKRNGKTVQVTVLQDRAGRATTEKIVLDKTIDRLHMSLLTMMLAEQATFLSAERTAQKKLRGMISRKQWAAYRLSGFFIEADTRSQLTYVLRRARPTIALAIRGNECWPLCALCLHPLAHYSGSWMGAMCPTDDVIAHLLYIRGDEYGFWKEANQHPLDAIQAGV